MPQASHSFQVVAWLLQHPQANVSILVLRSVDVTRAFKKDLVPVRDPDWSQEHDIIVQTALGCWCQLQVVVPETFD